jgi:hypothetical protein
MDPGEAVSLRSDGRRKYAFLRDQGDVPTLGQNKKGKATGFQPDGDQQRASIP